MPSINVLITSWIEANKKSLAFWAILIFKPVGSDSCAFASTFSKSEIVSVALEPCHLIDDTRYSLVTIYHIIECISQTTLILYRPHLPNEVHYHPARP